jgi:DNA invertase Pin-like site-specific DNA recombinase
MTVFGYARASRSDQNLDLQRLFFALPGARSSDQRRAAASPRRDATSCALFRTAISPRGR